MVSSEPVRLGLVGAGSNGLNHAREAANDPRADVAGVADVSAAARERAAEILGLPDSACFEGHDELYASLDLDGVLISTPHTLHFEHLTAAVDEGLHVQCEKPLVTGVKDAAAVVELDREVDTAIVPGYQRHLGPTYRAAREWWRANAGAPTGISMGITQDWIGPNRDTWRCDPDLSGGGFCYDTGSHIIDILCWITGLIPTGVRAEMTFVDEEQRVDAAASLLVDFETDVTATVTLDGDVHEVYEHHQFWSNGAGMVIEGEGWTDRTLEVRSADWRSTPRPDGESRTRVGAFLDTIVDGAEPPATTCDALKTTAVTEAAYESARSRERVPIGIDLADYAPE